MKKKDIEKYINNTTRREAILEAIYHKTYVPSGTIRTTARTMKGIIAAIKRMEDEYLGQAPEESTFADCETEEEAENIVLRNLKEGFLTIHTDGIITWEDPMQSWGRELRDRAEHVLNTL